MSGCGGRWKVDGYKDGCIGVDGWWMGGWMDGGWVGG